MADSGTVHQLKNMILSFRVAELQMLLGYAGKPKCGKKNELQAQALDLLKGRTLTIGIQSKIRELHKQRFTSGPVGMEADSGQGVTTRSGAGMHSSVHSGSVHSGSVHSSAPSTNNHYMPSQSMPSLTSNLSKDYPKHYPQALSQRSTDYYGSMPRMNVDYNKPYSQPPPAVQMQYPVYPDVRFKVLPFYDLLGELLKPSSLIPTANSRFQESTFSFHLTPQQANDIAMSREVLPGARYDYAIQVQLRFCLLETSCDQDDNFPPSICVKVNSKMCPLPNPLPTNKPGVEPKRPSRPVNITNLCRLSPTVSNQISISWASEYGRPYAVGIFLVKKLTSEILLQRIRNNGIRNADHTRAMIKEKLAHDPDSEIATMSLRGSLLCPLGKMRIQIPCRAITCSHVQCFDALLYLQMNEKKPSWICPVCDKPAAFNRLSIDGLFSEIINNAPINCNEVQFHEDGSWTPVVAKKENFETLDQGIRNSKKRPLTPEATDQKRKKIDVITIDSSDDDDDDDETNKSSSSVIPTTPVLSSGSGSESETATQSLPSPDSSSTASCNAIPITNSQPAFTPSYFTTTSAQTPAVTSTPYSRTNPTTSASLFTNRPDNCSSISSYSSMPSMLSSTAPSYYSSNNYSLPDFLVNSSNSFFNSLNSFQSNFELNATLDNLFRQDQDREPNYYNSGTNSNRRTTQFDPDDIISID